MTVQNILLSYDIIDIIDDIIDRYTELKSFSVFKCIRGIIKLTVKIK